MADPKSQYDLLVIGSGVGGLTAALTAALDGLSVLVVEHLDVIGGTSARSSGTVWCPGHPFQSDANADEDRDAAHSYLSDLTDGLGASESWEQFLSAGPKALADLRDRAGLHFTPLKNAPDYRQDCPGASTGGRALAPDVFDGRLLGDDFERIAPPLSELMLFGGMMITRPEAASLLKADRSLSGFKLGLGLISRYLKDRIRHKRGTRLVLGNALVARLYWSCLQHGVTFRTNVSIEELITKTGSICGAITSDGEEITTNRGVVLAGGGFPSDPKMRLQNLPSPTPKHTPASPGANGTTLRLAQRAGAEFGPNGLDNAFWFPSSIAKWADGSTAVYPHIVLDRAKPGVIAVNAAGARFVNEAVSYHEFVRAMYVNTSSASTVPAWLICDRAFIRRYGLGLIRPRTPYLGEYVKSGYLRQAPSIDELARRIDVDAAGLSATVTRFNAFAKNGVDQDFGRGENPYDRSNGDAEHQPNPCLGTIAGKPYFALALWPTPLATSRGIVTDHHARALTNAGDPLNGLYVSGSDMQSVFHGEYPGGGAQLGQAITYGWLAGKHAARTKNERTSG